jgi:hypothetical protein
MVMAVVVTVNGGLKTSRAERENETQRVLSELRVLCCNTELLI